jgi:transposase InsO family protein
MRSWREWRQAVVVVQPETVIRWSRQCFRTYWARKSHQGAGRPVIAPELRALIREISLANPLWGVPRIHSELRTLGITVSPTTVAKYRVRQRQPPSPTWRTFLRTHARDLVAVDFFTVPTATFQVLFVCVVLAHHRRRIVHLNVTANPTAEWTAQQIVDAFPEETAPRYLLRDRDAVYGSAFRRRIDGLGIHEVLTAARSPWQNPYVERVIGSIRRECLDHVIVLNERHLRRVLRTYLAYYHRSRCHLALRRDAPDGRAVQGPDRGTVIAFPEVGGLHHRYERRAA